MMTTELSSNPVFQPYLEDGRVDYDRLKNDEWLPKMIRYVEQAEVDQMNRSEQLAFWLNAYNILTLKAVLEKLEDDPQWSGLTSVFRKFKFFYWNKHRVAGQRMSLYHLENKILRQEFSDPRIHFAINCASQSCPYLPHRLFEAKTLDQYLDQLSSDFINDQGGARLDNGVLYVSEIFKMYKEDFGGEQGIVKFIEDYWKGEPIPEQVSLQFMEYDWSLNKQI